MCLFVCVRVYFCVFVDGELNAVLIVCVCVCGR